MVLSRIACDARTKNAARLADGTARRAYLHGLDSAAVRAWHFSSTAGRWDLATRGQLMQLRSSVQIAEGLTTHESRNLERRHVRVRKRVARHPTPLHADRDVGMNLTVEFGTRLRAIERPYTREPHGT